MFSPHESPATSPARPKQFPRPVNARPRAKTRVLLRASASAVLLALLLAATALPASQAATTAGAASAAFFAFQLPSLDEAVATYEVDAQGNCTATAKTAFTLGDKVCAKVTNAPTFGDFVQRRFYWVDPSGRVIHITNITQATQTDIFQLPSAATDEPTPGLVYDNRGEWLVNTVSWSSFVRAGASFDVSDGTGAADVGVYNAVTRATAKVAAGTDVVFQPFVYNAGPDAATNVVLTIPVPANTTFESAVGPVGTGFSCTHPDQGETGDSVCTIATLASRARVGYTFTYKVNANQALNGTRVVSTAGVTSATADPRSSNNSSSSSAFVYFDPTQVTCTLTCPANVVATANTTQNGQPGAFVKFGAATVSGECGAVSNSPASGSFFAVGTHTVTSSSQAGGGSCAFTVKVLDTPAPTISCPPTRFATADENGSATVVVGVPTFTASGGGSVTGVRSDSVAAVHDDDGSVVTPASEKALTDPYPAGITGITWTVTDADGRTASCRQRIVVRENPCGDDNTPPTITSAPPNITVGTGPGNTGPTVALDDELGQIEATDNCSVTVTISGIPPNGFPIGTTSVTHTATDGAGNSVSHVQQVTVVDNTPPFIAAPANAAYTCPSEVPAASPSQATRGDVFDEDGNLLPPGPPFDNSGTVTVTVSETSSGAGSVASPRVITRVFTATDPSLNSSSATQTITVTDPTPPTLNAPADITTFLPPNSTAVSMPVGYSATASDNCSNPVNVGYSHAPGSTFPVGTTAVTVTATDWAGNQTVKTFNVTVLYNFTGFFSPVGNQPVLNTVNAGRAVPVKFSLSGNKGAGIFAAGSPASGQVSCGANASESEVSETVTAGGSSLNYDPATDLYNYVWKTDPSWAGTCRQLVLTLNDGSVHRANFKFK